MVSGYNERMGKIEGGEERFFKNLTPPFLQKYIKGEYINFVIELKQIL